MEKFFFLVPKSFPIDEPTWINVSDNTWKHIADNYGIIVKNEHEFSNNFNRGDYSAYYLRILTP
jgi:hypothetical protein